MSRTFKLSVKMLASLLALLMTLYVIPLEGFAVAETGEPEIGDPIYSASENLSPDEDDPALVLYEDNSLRSPDVKQYRMTDGSFTAVKFDGVVHYENADGELVDIDNALFADPNAKEGVPTYTNKDNDVDFIFEGTPGNGKVSAQFGGYGISFGYIDAEPNNPNDADTSDGDSEKIVPTPEVESELVIDETEDISADAKAIVDTGDIEYIDTDLIEDSDVTEPEAVESEELQIPSETDEIVDDSKEEANEVVDDIENDEYEFAADNEGEAADILAEVPDVEGSRSFEIVISNPQEADPDGEPLDIFARVKANHKEEDRKKYGYTLEEAFEPLSSASSIAYKSDDLTLEYYLDGENLKESIIVSEVAEEYSYRFDITTEGLVPVLDEDGAVRLLNEKDEPIFLIPAPYMFDDNGERSENVTYSLEETENGGYTLIISADTEWINSGERQFPVTIDPTLYLVKYGGGGSSIDISTQYYRSYSGTTGAVNAGKLYLGFNHYTGEGEYTGYFRVNNLPTIPNNCVPVNARIALLQRNYDYNNTLTSFKISARDLTSSFTPPSGETNLGAWYNYVSTAEADIYDYQIISSNRNGYYTFWNITPLVQGWYNGSKVNRGVALVNETPGSSSNYANAYFAGYYSGSNLMSHRPKFIVTYLNTVGIDDRYSYLTQNVGRAGTGYVRANDAKLTFIKGILSNTGTAQPFSISHVFNSAYATNKFVPNSDSGIHTLSFWQMNLGYGWKLSIQQTIVSTSFTDFMGETINYKIYTDEDGTEHYFYQDEDDDTLYKDEEGLGLEIKVDNSTTMTMSNDKDNKWIFKNGYLQQIEDANGNKINILYENDSGVRNSGSIPDNSHHRIYSVTQTIRVDSGTPTTKTIATLTYTNGFLTGLTDEGGRNTTIVYSSERVIKINHSDGTQARFTYNSTTGNMTYAYDAESQYGIQYGYNSSTKAVANFYEFICPVSSFGTTSTYTYGARYWIVPKNMKKTYVRYSGADRAASTADDIVTTYLFDNYGRTANSYSANAIPGNTYASYRVYGTSDSEYTPTKTAGENCKSNNRISAAASTGGVPVNLITNPGTENGTTGWTLNGGSIYASSIHRTGSKSIALDNRYGGNGDAMMYQTVALKSGWHTFSVFAKADVTSVTGSGGIYLGAYNSTMGNIYSRKIISTTSDSLEGGWERLSVSFNAPADGWYQLSVYLKNTTGFVYLDDFQLEECEGFSNVSLLENGPVEQALSASSWVKYSDDSVIGRSSSQKFSGSYSLKLTSNISGYSAAKNIVMLNETSSTSSFILSGWAYANSVPYRTNEDGTPNDGNDAPKFKLFAKLYYTDGTTAYKDVKFNPEVRGEWQFVSGVIVPSKPVTKAEVCCFYANNNGAAYFDNISFVREASQTYKYDSNGKLIRVDSSETEDSTNYTYSGANLMQCTKPGSGTYNFDYYSSSEHANTHLVKNVKNKMGTESDTSDDLTNTFTYDAAGNMKNSKLYGGSNSSSNYISTSATYDNNNYLKTQTNEINVTTTNTYDSKHRLASVSSPKSNTANTGSAKTTYQYDTSDRVSVSTLVDAVRLTNTYTNGLLTQTVRRGYYNSAALDQTYTTAYDSWSNVTSITVGGRTLGTYTYASNNGNLISESHQKSSSNTVTISYTYDYLDRVKTVSYNNTVRYEYWYESSGALSHVKEYDTNTDIYYQYDSLGRLISQSSYNGNTLLDAEYFSYDNYNRTSSVNTTANGNYASQSYTYNNLNGLLTHAVSQYNKGSSNVYDTFDYDYDDALYRLTGKVFKHHAAAYATLTANYSYVSLSNKATTLVSDLEYKKGETSPTSVIKYSYEYDNIGNIKTVKENNTVVARYFYDAENQLVMEVSYSAGKTYRYVYDTFGNIRIKKTYNSTSYTTVAQADAATPASTVNYTYGNTSFRDLLTKYGSTTISYDNLGNPANWTNGATLTWGDARKLASYTKTGTSVSYAYNGDGLRTNKTVDGVIHNYYYNGTKLAIEAWSESGTSYNLHFIYDANGSPYAVVYKIDAAGTTNDSETIYYYITDLQGDITKIVDTNIGVVANYTYDAWGNVVSVKNAYGNAITSPTHIANVNPLRYRGYYYDTETALYYLQTRYYDPAVGRFLNADCYTTTGSFLGYNMYAYCENNPVMMVDSMGDRSIKNTMVQMADGRDIKSIFGGNYIVSCTISIYPTLRSGIIFLGDGIKRSLAIRSESVVSVGNAMVRGFVGLSNFVKNSTDVSMSFVDDLFCETARQSKIVLNKVNNALKSAFSKENLSTNIDLLQTAVEQFSEWAESYYPDVAIYTNIASCLLQGISILLE